MVALIDTHTHLFAEEFDEDRELAIIRATEAGVTRLFMPNIDDTSVEAMLALCNSHDGCYPMIGFHPTSVDENWKERLGTVEKWLRSEQVFYGIGEVGMDLYWDKTFNDIQQEVFIKQIKLANKHNLPICVHDREAHKDTFDILKEYNKGSDVVLHCYSGSVEFAKECIKEGWYLGLGGVVTFKNAVKMKETAKEIPLEKIVLETDAPYLTPVPFRGKENQPAYVKYVAEEISYIKGIPLDEVAEITSQNAERIYRI